MIEIPRAKERLKNIEFIVKYNTAISIIKQVIQRILYQLFNYVK